MPASAVASGHWPGTGLQVTALSWAAAEGFSGSAEMQELDTCTIMNWTSLDLEKQMNQILTFSGRSVWGCLTGADFQKALSIPCLPSTALGATQNEQLE